jgi:hypothetical protein
VAHAVKGGGGDGDKNVYAAAALPHAVAPVEAPSLYCCCGEQSVYCYGGAEESKGGGGEEEKNGEVAPVGASSVYSCDGAEKRKRRDGGAAATFSNAVAPVGVPSAAAAGL